MASPQLHSAASRSGRLAKEEDVQQPQQEVSEPFVPDQTPNIRQGMSAKALLFNFMSRTSWT